MDRPPIILTVTPLRLIGNIVPHVDVGGGPDIDVGIHILHSLQLIGGNLLHVLGVGTLDQGPFHRIVEDVDKGLAAHGIGLLNQSLHQSRFTAVQLNEDFLTCLELHRSADEKACQLPNARIFHVNSFLSCP